MSPLHRRSPEDDSKGAARISRYLSGLLALACAAGGLWLASHHPLSGTVAVLLFAAAALGSAWKPSLWPVLLPAALPLVALAPWSGWITVEEVDLMVLAFAAGAHGRWCIRPWRVARGIDIAAPIAWLLLAIWTASVMVALWRGLVDAGGLSWDWYQIYRGPMNAVRLAKPTLAIWLLLPLWLRLEAQPQGQAVERLTLGLALGHGATALACLYERLAYTGLLNFSSDYRTTGPFWEMHVGGAGLDAFLALSLPFAWRQWRQARSRPMAAMALLILMLGAYAALTTFSRILLIALPLGVVVMLLMEHLARSKPLHTVPAATGEPAALANVQQMVTTAALGIALSAAGVWMFAGAGYRGLLAQLLATALLLMLAPRLVGAGIRTWVTGLLLALACGPAWIALGWIVPKGPYVAFGLVFMVTLGLLLRSRSSKATGLALAGYLITVANAGAVAWFWGDALGGTQALPAVGLLLLAPPLCAALKPSPWPDSLRWQGGVLAMLGLAAMVTGIFGGGAYMSGRIQATNPDSGTRVQHWKDSLGMARDSTTRWLGLGLGRYLDNYAVTAPNATRPGDVRLLQEEGRTLARLVAGPYSQSWGDMMRLTQRVARPSGQVTVRAEVRAVPGAVLHAEICIKHLLYDDGCQTSEIRVPGAVPTGRQTPGPAAWHTLVIPLAGAALPLDSWLLPRATALSLAAGNAAATLDLRRVSAVDASGRELLTNGDFSAQGARWFTSSDRNHMPWHAKNMAVHLLVEQGVLGLAALALMTLAALFHSAWRLSRLPLAPAITAALVGCWIVGGVDSVLDMPRVALALLFLTAVGVAQRPR